MFHKRFCSRASNSFLIESIIITMSYIKTTMKNLIKFTLVVAGVTVSATIGYCSYVQYKTRTLAYANSLMEENICALSEEEEGPTYFVKICYVQKNEHGDASGYVCQPSTTSQAFKNCPSTPERVNKLSQQSHCIEIHY